MGETISVTRPISYCHNIRAFLNYVKEDRNLPNTKIKIGLDKGKKSLKFTCSLFSPYSDDQTQDFLLAVVHYVEESYANVLKMLSLCEIDLMDWDFFCSDMKMTMIVLGKYFLSNLSGIVRREDGGSIFDFIIKQCICPSIFVSVKVCLGT